MNFQWDTHRENALKNKTQELTKSMNMNIWILSILNQLFVRGSYTEIKFSKNKVVSGKTPHFVIGPFCIPHSICLNIDFWKQVLYGNVTFSIVVLSTKKWNSSFSKKAFCFSQNLFQSYNNENVQNFQWQPYKDMPIS